MHILAIDTATNRGGLALSRNGEVVQRRHFRVPLRCSEEIIPVLQNLLEGAAMKVGQIDCFGVATGPGSFTGLRIGLATAKAFCQALERPAVGVSTLKALAFHFRDVHPRVAPMLDAGRHQIYGALYRFDRHRIEVESRERVAHPEQWLEELPPGECLFVGDGATLHRELIASRRPGSGRLDSDNELLDALCLLTWQAFRRGEGVAAERLQANYVRPSDAELSRAGAPRPSSAAGEGP